MTRFQKAFCVFLCLCFFGVLAFLPEPFSLWRTMENVYRQFPLYCFLEEKARRAGEDGDEETNERIVAANADYLSRLAAQENADEKEAESSGKQEISGEEPGKSAEQNEETAGRNVETAGQKAETADQNVETADQNAETAGQKAEMADQNAETAGDNANTAGENAGTAGQKAGTSKRNSDASEPGDRAADLTETDRVPETDGDSAIQDEKENSSTQPEEENTAAAQTASAQPHPILDLSPERLADYDYLLGNFYIVDENTSAGAVQLNAENFLAEDLSIEKDASKPQILIYHSHSQETFADSREGEQEDTVVGVGNYLTALLTKNYGWNVLHVTEPFDIIDGQIDRSKAYDYAREYLEQVLEENPSIEVIIDLHRDGVSEDRRLVTEINGKSTAQIMFYNGLSYTAANGPVDYLPNPYIQDNLAFSFQLEYQAAQYYPELYRGIYLAGLRYNLHLRPKSLLLEAGAQTNTVQEVKNAMEPFADILNKVLDPETTSKSQ